MIPRVASNGVLDLEGGVSFTLEMSQPENSQGNFMRSEELSKAIDIMANRIDGLGVAEPVIRAVGDNRIEIQMPGLDLRQNPDVVDAVKKPARLEFKMVHRTAVPNPNNPSERPPPGYVRMVQENEDAILGM